MQNQMSLYLNLLIYMHINHKIFLIKLQKIMIIIYTNLILKQKMCLKCIKIIAIKKTELNAVAMIHLKHLAMIMMILR